MTHTRRDWLRQFLGLTPALAALAAAEAAQTPLCTGEVKAPNGQPHVNWTVQLHAVDGTFQQEKTNAKGEFSFAAVPQKSPYTLLFKNQGLLVMHEIRRLTPATNQRTSITVDPEPREFVPLYNQLQASEWVAVEFTRGAQVTRDSLRGDVQRLSAALKQIRGALAALPGEQQRFLTVKADNVEQLARAAVA